MKKTVFQIFAAGLAVLALLSVVSGPTARADWASGGGALVQDARNPWFLQNTPVIDVCLIWDKRNFNPVDTSAQDIVRRIEGAFAYWRREFARAYTVGNVVQVAQQQVRVRQIVEIDVDQPLPGQTCWQPVDLQIQLGWLSAEQQTFFNERMGGVQRYIAALVRTDYDQVRMRGKGFLYLSADSGPLAPDDPDVVRNPWSLGSGALIDNALIHELGHLFGVPHKGTTSIMAEDYLERIFNPKYAWLNARYVWSAGFFAWDTGRGQPIRSLCWNEPLRRGWREFLQADADDRCIDIVFGDSRKVLFYTGKRASGADMVLRGVMTTDARDTWMWDEVGTIFLPKDQTVITHIPDGAGNRNLIMGPMIKISDLPGTYVSTDGSRTARALFTLSPNGVGFAASRFSVELDGRWIWNMDWEY